MSGGGWVGGCLLPRRLLDDGLEHGLGRDVDGQVGGDVDRLLGGSREGLLLRLGGCRLLRGLLGHRRTPVHAEADHDDDDDDEEQDDEQAREALDEAVHRLEVVAGVDADLDPDAHPDRGADHVRREEARPGDLGEAGDQTVEVAQDREEPAGRDHPAAVPLVERLDAVEQRVGHPEPAAQLEGERSAAVPADGEAGVVAEDGGHPGDDQQRDQVEGPGDRVDAAEDQRGLAREERDAEVLDEDEDDDPEVAVVLDERRDLAEDARRVLDRGLVGEVRQGGRQRGVQVDRDEVDHAASMVEATGLVNELVAIPCQNFWREIAFGPRVRGPQRRTLRP